MHTIAYEDYEEAQSFVKEAEHQIGEVQHILSNDGAPFFEEKNQFPIKLSPVPSCSDVSDMDAANHTYSISRCPSPSFLVYLHVFPILYILSLNSFDSVCYVMYSCTVQCMPFKLT